MIEITLKNSSKLQIKRAQFVGELVDSNGTKAGGFTTYTFTEAELNALSRAIDVQAIYDMAYPASEQAEQTQSENE